MKSLRGAWCLSVLLLTISVSGAERNRLRGHLPEGVTKIPSLGRMEATARLDLAIGLPLRRREALGELLQQLCDPASPKYRQFLTPAQFAELFCPTEADYQAVIAFAKSKGLTVTGTHPNRMLVNVNGSVTAVEKAFQVTMRVHPHPKESRTFYAPNVDPSLDTDVPVLAIGGLNNYALARPLSRKTSSGNQARRITALGGSGPGGAFLGRDFRAAYAPGGSLTGAGQTVALVQFDGYYPADIITYKNLANLPDTPIVSVLVDGFDGTPGPNNSEVALDIQMAISMAPGLSQVLVYQAPPTGHPNTVLNRIATDNQARQISASWGYPIDAITEQIYQQFAAQGQSFFNASGDDGAYVDVVLQPTDNPHITIVGGTTLATGSDGAWTSETSWNWSSTGLGTSASGGGFGTNYTIPSWQTGLSMAANQGSFSFRNLPDVSMVGDNVWVVWDNGSRAAFGGTSVASPLWAGFIALVNEQAAANGMPPVGFLNPALYAIGKGSNYLTCFHDITTGNNTNRLSPERFFAVPGYDLCTGWGTPTGSNLINALAPPPSTPILVVEGASLLAESCSPFNGLIDPGEVVTVSLRLRNLGVKDTSNLVATLLTNSGITPVSGPGTYGVIPARGPVAEQTFEFSAQGACGSRILIELQLRDGASDLGKVSLEMPLGQTITSFNQDFEGVQLPALPWSCSTSSTNGGSNWLTSIIAQPNGSNAVYVVEAEVPSISDLVSPVINLTSPGAMLSFRQNYYLEADPDLTTNGYDGGVLEIKIADEPFRDILDAGGSFAAGGYTRTLDPQNDNPLGGRRAWSGLSGGFITTLVNLPASATGNPIQFRWRLGTDTFNGLGGTGWYLDDVSVIVGYSCCGDSNAAPEIVVHPVNRVAAVGTDASLLVATTGSFPLSFQWHLNGTDLVGATTNPLTLTNVQLAQAGDYSVVVTNRAGSAISTPAHLTVLLRPSIELVGFGTSGTELSISVETVPGVNYTLEYKDSLDAPNWTPVLPAVQGNGGMILLKDTTGIQSASRFYRVSSH